jgi:hypothetical protein
LKEVLMRPLCLTAVLALALAASPILAADKTIVLRLRHYPATDIDRVLLPENFESPVPAGILAWTVDERRNSVSVTGSEAAIREFRKLVRLIDVPKPQVRLAVRMVRIEPSDLRALDLQPAVGVEPLAFDTGVAGASTFLSREQVTALEARPVLRATQMTVSNQQPLHLRWVVGTEMLPALASIVPRVNGDGSVTLMITLREVHPRTPQSGPSDLVVLRRLPVGTAVAMLPRTPNVALLVTVREARRR